MFKFQKYKNNPILRPHPDHQWENLCVLNPGVIYDEANQEFVMLYRAGGDEFEHYIRLGKAVSKDGFCFTRCSDKPNFDVDVNDADGGCVEDPRIVKMDDIYYITYASRAYYPGKYWIGPEKYYAQYDQVEKSLETPRFIHKNSTVTYLAMTRDFETYKRLGRITDARKDNRDVILFPEKVNGKYVRLSRPYKMEVNGKKINPSVFISFSDDLIEWDEEEFLFSGEQEWESEKVGGSCPPIRTPYGWLEIYHGVSNEPRTYHVGAVMLDLNDPRKILARTKTPLMSPEESYELETFLDCKGFPKVVFPCGNVVKDDVLYVYYGTGDMYVCVATASFSELCNYLMTECKV